MQTLCLKNKQNKNNLFKYKKIISFKKFTKNVFLNGCGMYLV